MVVLYEFSLAPHRSQLLDALTASSFTPILCLEAASMASRPPQAEHLMSFLRIQVHFRIGCSALQASHMAITSGKNCFFIFMLNLLLPESLQPHVQLDDIVPAERPVFEAVKQRLRNVLLYLIAI